MSLSRVREGVGREASMKALPKRKGNVTTVRRLKSPSQPASMKAPPKRKGNFAISVDQSPNRGKPQ